MERSGSDTNTDSDTDTDTNTDSDTEAQAQVLLSHDSIPPEGITLIKAGVYRFTENITWRPIFTSASSASSATALRIACDGVTIDFANFSLILDADTTPTRATAISAIGHVDRPLSRLKICCGTLHGFLSKAIVLAHVHDAVISRVVTISRGTAVKTKTETETGASSATQSFLIAGCTQVRVLWCAFEALHTRATSFCCVRVVASIHVTIADVVIKKCRALRGCLFYAGVLAVSSRHVKVVRCRIGSIVAADADVGLNPIHVHAHAIFAGVYLRACQAATVLSCRVVMIEALDMGQGATYGIYVQDCSNNTTVKACDVHDIRAGGSTQHATGVAAVHCNHLSVLQCTASRVEAPSRVNATGFAHALCAAATIFDACRVDDAGVGFGHLCYRRKWREPLSVARYIRAYVAPSCDVAFGSPCRG